jgi:mobilome CxxCx(11)CxxC protein
MMATPQECWNLALEAFGTADIFERRAGRLSTKIKWLAFMGLGQVVVVGATVISFGTKSSHLEQLLYGVGIVAVGQAMISLWALIANWDTALSYASESQAENNRLSRRFVDLAGIESNDVEFRVKRAEYEAREAQDAKQQITEKEKRRGMRSGLRQFRRQCDRCKLVPESMDASKCSVCGNF